jgi:phenylacetate-coenzyme A ligase PaaK-like adenylate-forming protein
VKSLDNLCKKRGEQKLHVSLIKIFGYFIGGLWTAWGGRKRIEAKQLSRLRRLVEKARKGSPLMKELYSGLPESDSIELQDLPATFKSDLMRDFDRWLTDRNLTLAQAREHMGDMNNLGVPIGKYAVFRTSGTSGEPAVIVFSPSVLEFIFGIFLARLSRRQRIIERKIRKAGTAIVITGGSGHFVGVGFDKLMQNIAPYLARCSMFIAAELPIERVVKKLNETPNIASILTYPSMLAILTREKEANRLKINPRFIKVAGETFTPALRLRAHRAFPSLEWDIIDGYGCTECLCLAVECEHGRLHVPEDWVVLEAVDKNMQPVPDGSLSDTALLTVLANDVQPFIRYDIGDRLRFYRDPCACGSPFRSFQVEGRQATLIHVGEVTLSALAFDLEHEGVQRAQLVQLAENVFEVRIEPTNRQESDVVVEQIIHSVKKVFEENGLPEVEVRGSAAPPQLTASGKFHEVLSLKKAPGESNLRSRLEMR